jgi:hypothetical protein
LKGHRPAGLAVLLGLRGPRAGALRIRPYRRRRRHRHDRRLRADLHHPHRQHGHRSDPLLPGRAPFRCARDRHRRTPAGWQLGASQPPPAPIFGGRSATGIAPGAAETFTFTTNVALPTGTQLKLSPNCRDDITVGTTGPTGPPPPPPPPPKPKKCECESLEVELRGYQPDPRRLSFYLDWTLECTRAGIGACKGKLTVELATAARQAGVRVSVSTPKLKDSKPGARGAWIVNCEGECEIGVARRDFTGDASVTVIAPAREPFGPQGVGSLMLEVDRFCKRELTTKRFRIAFNDGGAISKRRSDLNGNGVADGKEKK